jgi:hypothetical protein
MTDLEHELAAWPKLLEGTEWWCGDEGYRLRETIYMGELIDVDVFAALGNAPPPGEEEMPDWLVEGMRASLEKQLH